MAISDANNERISGASIELVGTGKVYYSNINGYCFIPKHLLQKAKKITVNSISYKTVQFDSDELNTKIILKSR